MDSSEETSDGVLQEAPCVLAHDLNNGLAIIAGHSELMIEADPDSQISDRLRLILDVVHRLAKRIKGHDCRLINPPGLASSETQPTHDHSDGNSQPKVKDVDHLA